MDSPLQYLDNDVLSLLPEYVEKMRRKVWWENLFNTLIRCYKGDYANDCRHIFYNKFPYHACDSKLKLLNFRSVISHCECYLENQFIKEYGCGDKDREPKMHTDFIPFYNKFKELTGEFHTSMLSDFRMNGRYPKLTEHYKYLRDPNDPYIKQMKDEDISRWELKRVHMDTNFAKEIAIDRILGINLRHVHGKEKKDIIKEKSEEIKQLKKDKIPYTKTLTDKDKSMLIEALTNYYYVMSVTKDLGCVSRYDIPKNMNKIKKNIEKIKLM